MTSLSRTHRLGVSLAALLALSYPPAGALAQQAKPLSKEADLKRADKEDMRPILEKLEALGAKDVAKLTVEQARNQPTPADAVMAVLKERGKDPAALMAALKVSHKDMSYPTEGGSQPIRLYTPEGATGPLPVIVYYHGGGWVIADIKTYEASTMALAHKANAIVASVEYRHAPEHKFPAAHEDAFAAYKWVLDNAASFGGDPSGIAIAGESAGGNLAVTTALKARDAGIQEPVHIVSVYPVAGTDMTTPSYVKNANAAPLSKAGMEWFVDKVLAKPEDKDSPLLNLYTKADLKGLPGVTIINAEIDPLESDGARLAEALKKAGVKVDRHVSEGVTHEFFGMAPLVDDAERAQAIAVKALKAAFAEGKKSAQ